MMKSIYKQLLLLALTTGLLSACVVNTGPGPRYHRVYYRTPGYHYQYHYWVRRY